MIKHCILIFAAALAVATEPADSADGLDVVTPSSAAIEPPTTLTMVAPSSSAVAPASGNYLREAAAQSRSMTAWKLSLAPVAAAEFLDAYSSRGMRELNPVLAGANGQFGAKAELLKAGIAGALIGMEYVVVHKHPGAAKVFWKINLISAGVTGGVAAHNFSLR